MNDPLTLLYTSAPQFAFAAFLFWLCSQQSDKQRAAYQAQIERLYDLIESALNAAKPLIMAIRQIEEAEKE